MKKEYISVIILMNIFLIAGYIPFYLFIKRNASNKQQSVIDNTFIPMPEYYKKVTGFDSIQLVYLGRVIKYDQVNKSFEVVWDSLTANFCYPNK